MNMMLGRRFVWAYEGHCDAAAAAPSKPRKCRLEYPSVKDMLYRGRVSQRIMRTHWHEPGFAMGLAYLHMGDLEKAHENFLAGKRFVEDFKVHCGHPPTDWVNTADPEEMNLRDLLDLLEHNPDAIPAHCDRVVEACVKANKLEDFWEPVTFSYSGTGGG